MKLLAALPGGGGHNSRSVGIGPDGRVYDLITGFQLKGGERWARPVGVAIGSDGALYFTGDSGTHGLFRLKRNP